MYKLWYIDDRKENVLMWEQSFPDTIAKAVELRSFTTWVALKAVFERDEYPDIVFVDYFLGNAYGTDVVEWIGGHCPSNRRPFVIAHSSAPFGNLCMLDAGADTYLEKRKGAVLTTGIHENFQSVEDIQEIVTRRTLSTPSPPLDEAALLAWIDDPASTL